MLGPGSGTAWGAGCRVGAELLPSPTSTLKGCLCFLQALGLPEQVGAGSIPSWGKGVFLYLRAWGWLTAQGIRCHRDRWPGPALFSPGGDQARRHVERSEGLHPGPGTGLSSSCGHRRTSVAQNKSQNPAPVHLGVTAMTLTWDSSWLSANHVTKMFL